MLFYFLSPKFLCYASARLVVVSRSYFSSAAVTISSDYWAAPLQYGWVLWYRAIALGYDPFRQCRLMHGHRFQCAHMCMCIAHFDSILFFPSSTGRFCWKNATRSSSITFGFIGPVECMSVICEEHTQWLKREIHDVIETIWLLARTKQSGVLEGRRTIACKNLYILRVEWCMVAATVKHTHPIYLLYIHIVPKQRTENPTTYIQNAVPSRQPSDRHRHNIDNARGTTKRYVLQQHRVYETAWCLVQSYRTCLFNQDWLIFTSIALRQEFSIIRRACMMRALPYRQHTTMDASLSACFRSAQFLFLFLCMTKQGVVPRY